MIIQSLLDTDLYKFTMQQVVWHRFPEAYAEYAFRNRTEDVDLRPFASEIRQEINAIGDLRFSNDELDFLSGLPYMRPAYVEYLRTLRLNPKQIVVDTTGDDLQIRVAGWWKEAILWEVPVLAIVNEVYFRHTQPGAIAQGEGTRRLQAKWKQIRTSPVPLSLMEFGTRRRYSRDWQQTVVETLHRETGASLVGTSNVHLARVLGLRPFGTMAHEFLQSGQAFAPVPDGQKWALEQWMQFYRGELGIALSDVVGFSAFLRDFDKLFSKAYDGARHDSGDPFEWGERLLEHYKKMGVDSRTKTLVWSDGLTIPKCIELALRFEGRAQTLFGVGTNLTNDFGFPALQIVLKLARMNGRSVAKISDTPGKAMAGDPVYLAYLQSVFPSG